MIILYDKTITNLRATYHIKNLTLIRNLCIWYGVYSVYSVLYYIIKNKHAKRNLNSKTCLEQYKYTNKHKQYLDSINGEKQHNDPLRELLPLFSINSQAATVSKIVKQSPELLELSLCHSQFPKRTERLRPPNEICPKANLYHNRCILIGQLLPLPLALCSSSLSKCLQHHKPLLQKKYLSHLSKTITIRDLAH